MAARESDKLQLARKVVCGSRYPWPYVAFDIQGIVALMGAKWSSRGCQPIQFKVGKYR